VADRDDVIDLQAAFLSRLAARVLPRAGAADLAGEAVALENLPAQFPGDAASNDGAELQRLEQVPVGVESVASVMGRTRSPFPPRSALRT
jgi:hypothetical protein